MRFPKISVMNVNQNSHRIGNLDANIKTKTDNTNNMTEKSLQILELQLFDGEISKNNNIMLTPTNFTTEFPALKAAELLDDEAAAMEADIAELLPLYDHNKEAKGAIDDALKAINENADLHREAKALKEQKPTAPSTAAVLAKAKLALVKVKLKLQLQLSR